MKSRNFSSLVFTAWLRSRLPGTLFLPLLFVNTFGTLLLSRNGNNIMVLDSEIPQYIILGWVMVT